MVNILDKLRGGDRRSTGKSDEVVKDLEKNPKLFRQVFNGILLDDPLIRMRAADAIEKFTRERPEYLQPFKRKLLNEIAAIGQQEVRWHVAPLLSRLRLTTKEKARVVQLLSSWFKNEKSRIVRVFSLQSLADLAKGDPALKKKVLKELRLAQKSGIPALISRSRKLIKELENNIRTISG